MRYSGPTLLPACKTGLHIICKSAASPLPDSRTIQDTTEHAKVIPYATLASLPMIRCSPAVPGHACMKSIAMHHSPIHIMLICMHLQRHTRERGLPKSRDLGHTRISNSACLRFEYASLLVKGDYCVP